MPHSQFGFSQEGRFFLDMHPTPQGPQKGKSASKPLPSAQTIASPEPTVEGFPAINLSAEPKRPSSLSSKDVAAKAKVPTPKKGKKPQSNMLTLYVSIASATVLVLIGLVVILGGGSDGKVQVRWKKSEREAASMTIDGKTRKVPSSETFSLALTPGKHTIEFSRAGYFDIQQAVNVEARSSATIDVNRWRPMPSSSRTGR